MKISIIIPVYNAEKYIESTLECVLSQSYPNIEVIAVDDGSKDDSLEILDRFATKDSRLKVIHKENGGVTSARISGIKESTGDYIGFVDSDDRVDSDMFERLGFNAVKYNADISHCGYRLIKNNEIKYFYNTGEIAVQDKQQGISDLLKGTKIEPGLWNKLFHRHLFDTLLNDDSIMDFSIKNNEDLLMNYILFKESVKSVYEDFCPYEYVARENSASKGKVNEHQLLDPIKASRIIFNDCDESLKAVAANLYVTKLIRTATYYGKEEFASDCRAKAQKELKSIIRIFISFKDIGIKRKMLALLASFTPKFYDIIHRIYLK